MSIQLKRAALGRRAVIGDFYDAKRDVFVDGNLFKEPIPQSSLVIQMHPSIHSSLHFPSSLKEKVDLIAGDDNLSLSILSGLVEVSGSAAYLEDEDDPVKVNCTFIHQIATSSEKASFADVGDLVDAENVPGEATHVVVEVQMGCTSIMSISADMENGDKDEVVKKLKTRLERTINGQNNQPIAADSLEIKIRLYLDADLPGDVPTNLEQGLQLILASPEDTVQIAYVMLPLEDVGYLLNLELKTLFQPLSKKQLDKAKTLVSESSELLLKIERFRKSILAASEYLPEDRVVAVRQRHLECSNDMTFIKQRLQELLPKVREDLEENLDDLYDFYSSVKDLPLSKEKMTRFMDCNGDLLDFLNFQETMKRNGVLMIKELDEYNEIRKDNTIYALIYSLAYFSHPSWSQNEKRFLELCATPQEGWIMAVVHVDVLGELTSEEDDGPRIAATIKDSYSTKNLLEVDKKIKLHNLAHPTEEFRKNHGIANWRLVSAKLPCPKCRKEALEWHCSECHMLLEYDLQLFFYCRCGRLPANYFKFECCEDDHGLQPVGYSEDELHDVLSQIQPYNRINILVIGETGVGKSTWINAFYSYICHESLEEAETLPLAYAIPFQFNLAIPTKTGVTETEIKYGSSAEEVYAPRKSSTQSPKAHYLKHGETVYCIIDTPGVGDCEGPVKDKENMQKIVNFVCNFHDIHLICFLLSPDQSRLTRTFEFCFNELIMQFHRSAVSNIAFCITKAIGVNFQVGDTHSALKTMIGDIKKRRKIDIPLNEENIFIFDNIAFRHIAAVQRGVIMDEYQITMARQSFNVTRNATIRMMSNAANRRPHNTRDTQGINFARTVVQLLSNPLAMIGVQVFRVLSDLRERQSAVVQHISDEKEQMKILNRRITFYRYRMVEEKNILCKACMTVQVYYGADREHLLKANPELAAKDPITFYVGTPIQKGKHCDKCGPKFKKFVANKKCFKNEIHKEEEDINVRQRIDSTLESRVQIQQLIYADEQLVQELEQEKTKIIKASTEFAGFLKIYSILPYNDATEEYLNVLMESEKERRGLTQMYKMYKEMLTSYREEKEIFENSLRRYENVDCENSITPGSIIRMVEELKQLKHYGEDIQQALDSLMPSYNEEVEKEENSFVRTSPLQQMLRASGVIKEVTSL